MPVVSTIIPVYNGGPFVAEAVESALAQRGVSQEVIVIDDGSTDNTAEILAQFGDAIQVIRQANAGLPASRNRGAEQARGEWLAFLDADDVWLPDKLAKQLAAADGSTALVYTDRINFGNVGRTTVRQSESTPQYEGNAFEELLCHNFITVSSVIMRKDWFDRIGGFDVGAITCEDWDLWLRLTAEGGIVKLLAEPLTRYRLHGTSMTNQYTRMCDGRLTTIRRALATDRGRRVGRLTVRRAYSSVWGSSAWNAAPTDRWKAVKWYLRSAWCAPWRFRLYRDMIKCCLGKI